MPKEPRPTAFVAMRFDGEHWRDRRYLAIREVLESAGYACQRSDEIRTSGPVVDEVCRLLRESDLVVIDSSGDSHSVSYEIGYCHGVGRPADSTLLLRGDADMPFNYRHYRHRVYRGTRNLRRLIRDYLKVSEPLLDKHFGYAFVFQFNQGGVGYVQVGAKCLYAALRSARFSGRCEFYAREMFEMHDRLFSIGVMLRPLGRDATPSFGWWQKLEKSVARFAAQHASDIRFVPELSEMTGKLSMAHSCLPAGTAEFSNGAVTRLLDSGEDSLLDEFYDAEDVQQG